MTKLSFNPNSQSVSHLRVRLLARLAVIFICLSLLVYRLTRDFISSNLSKQAATTFIITMPVLGVFSLIILSEYLLYRKVGTRILRYSKYFDIMFTLVFTADGILTLNGQFQSLQTVQGDDAQYFTVYTGVGFATLGWRTLLPILITQQWQLRVIPSIIAYIYLISSAVVYQPEESFLIIFRGILQMIYVILIYYLDHRINFTVMIGNIQNEQWLQLNGYILNNIPENIAIMDSNGNAHFINENFKRLIQHNNQSQGISKFLRNIKYLKSIQQDEETEAHSHYIQETQPLEIIPSSESKNELPIDTNCDVQTISSLEERIINFGKGITIGSIKESSFQVFSGKFKHEDDQERSFEIKISFINQQSKKYILLILRDTTQRDLLLTLEGNIKYKDQLLASVSHELRTPLNGNINLIEAAMKSKDIPEKIKETLLTPAMRSSQFLLHLINDILDMSQMKARKLRLIFQQTSLRETLNNTIQLLELHAKKKGINLETNLDPELPAMFCTDHVRLSQIVLNLMNNSIKFTQKGYVRLSACPLKDSDYVNISVEDTGIGMTQEDTNKLFQDFTHIDCKNREKINPSGVGLGLKIGNDLAKLLGPQNNKGISVTSEPGKGSTFSFLIENKETGLNSQNTRIECKEDPSPLVPNEFQTIVETDLNTRITRNISVKSLLSIGKMDTESMESIPSCTCPRVLVVDDDPFNILAYEAILNSLGVKFDCAYSGRSAIDKMLNKVRYPCSPACCPHQVVFMDEQMPEMTGGETVREIVALQRQNLLPLMTVIGCTAHHDGEALDNFMKCGIAEYIPKPVSTVMIQKMLKKYNV